MLWFRGKRGILILACPHLCLPQPVFPSISNSSLNLDTLAQCRRTLSATLQDFLLFSEMLQVDKGSAGSETHEAPLAPPTLPSYDHR